MVLDKLSESLKGTLQKIARAVFVDEKLINELIKDIQRALLQADVNVKQVFELTNNIKAKALKEKLPDGLSKKEQLINIVYDELVQFLGGEGHKIEITSKPFIILLAGLFGSGKTTTAGKLAKFFSKRGFKTCLVGLDVHRPAAMDQIEQVAKQVTVPVFIEKEEKDAQKIWKKYESETKKHDVVIVDTAGRDALSDDLISELRNLTKLLNPSERLLVISADIGQAAEKQAIAFHESCNITGVIATKMDSTAKAGGALSACAVTQAPIKFIGVGEKPDDMEEFKPKNFVGRLLGMGDIEALLEKAKDAMTEDQAEDLSKRVLKGDFNLVDLYEQMQAMRKMGPLNKVMDMVPGFGQIKLPKDLMQQQEGKLDKWKYAMDSMTVAEKEDPDSMDRDRIDRIAKGSGVGTGEIRELLKQYRQSKKMIKMIKPGNQRSMNQMMKKLSSGQMKGKF